MPTTYAHYRFGFQTAERLPASCRDVIREYPELFYTGVHGPDLLFYYKPTLYGPITRMGSAIHAKPGLDFFKPAADVLQRDVFDRKELSYLYGFLCHFALDRACHGYVNEQVGVTGVSHTGIEAELDRAFLTEDGFDPVTTKLTGHLHPGMDNASVIAKFFPKVSAKKINHAMKGQIFYLDFLVTPSKGKRAVCDAAFHAVFHYPFLHGLFIGLEPNPDCAGAVEHLVKLYGNALDDAVSLITDFVPTAQGKLDWSPLYNYDFDGRMAPVKK